MSTTPATGGDHDRPADDSAAHSPADPSAPPVPVPAEATEHPDRSVIIGMGGRWLTDWALRLSIILVAGWLLYKVGGQLWVGILPVLLALIVSTVLWPVVRFLTRWHIPAALASLVAILGTLGLVAGILALVAPSIVDQSAQLGDKATEGIQRVQTWIKGPPFNVQDEQLDAVVAKITSSLQTKSEAIASGVFSGVTALGEMVVTLLLVLVLVFFFLKDGPSFLPWMRRLVGRKAGMHLTEVLTRSWNTLSGFIKAQAIVSLVDAVCIGIGLVALGVPLAWALAVITFLGGFIPIIGGFTAGTLGVMVALVANGPMNAIIVLVLIVAVMQLEGHILQPFLQSKAMNLHPVVVLLAVAAGGTLYGIIGAFLAVPFAAVAAVLLRYLGEQIDLRTGEVMASDLTTYTDEGKLTAWLAELSSSRFAPVRRGSTALLGGLVDGRGEGAETADEDDDEPAAAAPRSDRTTDETQSDGNAPARRRRARGFRRRRRDR